MDYFSDINIGFIGAGSMATSLITGILQNNVINSSQIYVACPSSKSQEKMRSFNVGVTSDNIEVVKLCQIIILAVKPDVLRIVLPQITEISPLELAQKTFISIAAGIPIALIEKLLNFQCSRLIRVMPNLPSVIGQGLN